jgi:GNAT superfamily N-acetyltransferase/predicted nucleotidyltransferase
MTFPAVSTAERLVRERFPLVRAAWLGGSAATGSMTSTSDLDITVLLPSKSASFRESLTVCEQPVELFVHTEDSLRFFCEQDRRRRRPTMLRLIGTSIVVIDDDGIGRHLQERFHRLDRQGPPALSADEIDEARYAVTDLLDDLANGGAEAVSIAATLWRETAELLLGAHARWCGTGKWLQRELQALDADLDTDHARALLSGLAAVGRGDTSAMEGAVNAALESMGGRLFDGYRRDGNAPVRHDAEVRLALAAEAPFLVEMARHACVIEDWPLPDPDSDDTQSVLPGEGDVSVVAIDPHGELVGAAWTFHPDPALVLDENGAALPEIAMAVLPALRGRGVGTALIDELIARCNGSHAALTLNVHQRNPAIRLYQRMGFQVLGQGRGALGVAMRRDLV